MPEFIQTILRHYVQWVTTYPIISAMIQFAILGTFGEIVSTWIVRRSFRYPFSFSLTLAKMAVWAVLAVGIKYAFKGYIGFVDYLEAHQMLPPLSKLGRAFSISAFMNLQFGLTLVLAHRLLDNLVERKGANWKGLNLSFFSLVWFWIPAHTFTFMLPDNYRIGLAALWSVVLGFILGLFKQRK
jgi:uncharacterized membrane protein YhdT